MPDAAARRHPLNATLADHIHLPRRGFVLHVKGQWVGQRGDDLLACLEAAFVMGDDLLHRVGELKIANLR